LQSTSAASASCRMRISRPNTTGDLGTGHLSTLLLCLVSNWPKNRLFVHVIARGEDIKAHSDRTTPRSSTEDGRGGEWIWL
jgi:hypothetical protein